ncbi:MULTISPECIES: helix-turn-helix domain-containing protein [Nonomuraea]|uniref:Helix-turn-helix domain-containing protein n=1 Tax=Nonomuraea mangrovi TaxID=2316207 RepID=A0ABW4T4W6_9ACTN
MESANSTLRQRQLAKRLRELRQESGLSIADVAERLLCSPAKISRLETARRRASLRDVRDLCAMYGLTDAGEVERLMVLARESRQDEWWLKAEDVDFRPLVGLESEAVAISEYETTTVPGLLQTPDYTRAVIRGYLPLIDPEVLEERLRVRMKRQEILSKAQAPRYWVLLDESALHRHVGGREVMRGQLVRLRERADLPNLTVQVIPYSAGAHMGFDAAFRLMEFANDTEIRDTVYMETLAGTFYIEKPAQLDRFREVLNYLRAVALSPQDSAIRIEDGIRYFTP